MAAACLTLSGQVADPARDPLEKAYRALAAKQYDAAIELFETAANAAPDRASIHQDLAYTYLKTGQTEAARDQFAQAMGLAPQDFHTALEYAFLCHETGRTAEAHHIFNLVREQGDPASRATAEQAFQNIDRPLAEGIERWSQAVTVNPDDFNAHRELAQLAERREILPLAAEHYLKAWRLRPEWRYLLVDLGRLWMAMGQVEQAHSAWLAASRGAEPRATEAARELLPNRYPYVYEFRQAMELDPTNTALRDELGYLLAAMGQPAVKSEQKTPAEVKVLGDRSYRAGYLQDALKYYSLAQELDPLDFRVLLQLGWTHNVMKQDSQAIRWFNLARKSPDPAIAEEGKRAYENLRPSLERFRTTIWVFPSYSSRWHDVFTYGQVKTEWKLGKLPLRAYLSTRLIGDTRPLINQVQPQYLSESSLIFGAGLATSYWHGAMLWAEAGSAAKYLATSRNMPRLAPDYRGGVSYSKGFGRLLTARAPGLFFETNDDGVFVSRFQNDFVFYSQNRFGYTLAPNKALGGLQTQWYWNANASADLRRQYWANALELGPGLRFRWKWMPSPWLLSVSVLRGIYRIREDNPYGHQYNDLRAGFWYAFTR